MKKRMLLSAVSAMAGTFLMVGVASATMINGGISFNGYDWFPITSKVDTALVIGIDFDPNSGLAGSGFGDLKGLNGLPMTNHDITFDPFAVLTPLWTIYEANGTTAKFSFNLNEITVLERNIDYISLKGVGTMIGKGFDATPGKWFLTTNSVTTSDTPTTEGGTTFSWSSSTAASPVPEPATMLLFGTGLAGLAGMARKRRAKLNS